MAEPVELLMMLDAHWLAVQGPGAAGPSDNERPLCGSGPAGDSMAALPQEVAEAAKGVPKGRQGIQQRGCSVCAGQAMASPSACPPTAFLLCKVPDSHSLQSAPCPLSRAW